VVFKKRHKLNRGPAAGGAYSWGYHGRYAGSQYGQGKFTCGRSTKKMKIPAEGYPGGGGSGVVWRVYSVVWFTQGRVSWGFCGSPFEGRERCFSVVGLAEASKEEKWPQPADPEVLSRTEPQTAQTAQPN